MHSSNWGQVGGWAMVLAALEEQGAAGLSSGFLGMVLSHLGRILSEGNVSDETQRQRGKSLGRRDAKTEGRNECQGMP